MEAQGEWTDIACYSYISEELVKSFHFKEVAPLLWWRKEVQPSSLFSTSQGLETNPSG